jgi:lipopolysaccharide transport system permease protein
VQGLTQPSDFEMAGEALKTPADDLESMRSIDGCNQTAAAEDAPSSALALTVIEPTPGWRSIDLTELWRYRELLYFLIWRDVKIRYKQTVLGAAWAVIQPLMGMLIFTIFFGKLGRLDEQVAAPYPVFVYAGLLPWLFFANAVTTGGQSLVSQAHLISKIYFPRLFVPLASVGAFLVDFAVSFAVLLCLMVGYGVAFGWGLLAVPLLTVATIIAAVGVGTLLAALTVAYRDFRYVVPFMVQIWMFVSPVVFPFEIVPQKWRLIYSLNPMAGIISGFRSAILGEPFRLEAIAISVSVGVVLLVAGSYYFRRVERRFADII